MFIPIALYISMEAIKLGHAYFIALDINMYDEETNTAVICRSVGFPIMQGRPPSGGVEKPEPIYILCKWNFFSVSLLFVLFSFPFFS